MLASQRPSQRFVDQEQENPTNAMPRPVDLPAGTARIVNGTSDATLRSRVASMCSKLYTMRGKKVVRVVNIISETTASEERHGPVQTFSDANPYTSEIPAPEVALGRVTSPRAPNYSVNVPHDGGSIVSSLESAGDLSYATWLKYNSSRLLVKVGEDENTQDDVEDPPMTEGQSQRSTETGSKNEASRQDTVGALSSLFGGTYASIAEKLQNKGANKPIKTFIPTSHEKGTAIEPSTTDATDEESHVSATGVELSLDTFVDGESGLADISVCASMDSLKKKKDDASFGNLSMSKTYRRVACGFAFLMLCCLGLAVAGLLSMDWKPNSSNDPSISQDTIFDAGIEPTTSVPPVEASDVMASSTESTPASKLEPSVHNNPLPLATEHAPPTSAEAVTPATRPLTNPNDVFAVARCEDDPDFKFLANDRSTQTCEWLSNQSESTIESFCAVSGTMVRFRDACAATCGNCPSS